ncbi:MAG: hypothetical protein A3F12_00685 [Gammaproteobacteria bacterium RIFCSPHIGHO2_12_FULL_38_14]|nr:MAG: hypothetical protein A3F12_00685 [Gammaproteobacteria bacterium RIFCSPHIGHO2_12_FULL_38_14]
MIPDNFSSKIVLVAGGTQGLGRGIILHLAKLGVEKLIICGRSSKNGGALVKDVSSLGVNGYFVQADLTKVSDCRKIYAHCEKNFGTLDGLVYAAGVSDRGTIDTMNETEWDKIFNTNLKGAFFLTQSLLPLLRKGVGKSIITICSFSWYCGRPEMIAYNASKAGLVTFTRSLANTLKEERIRVNGINLGWTETDNERKLQNSLGNPDDWLSKMGMQLPFGRLIYPQDVAYLVEFLLSAKSQMMTGSIIDYNQKVRI